MPNKNIYRHTFLLLFAFIITLISSISSPLYAEEPFYTITFRLNFLANTNRNTFHQYWDPKFGIEGVGEMPFYLGSIESGLHLFSFEGKSGDYPEFTSTYIFVGWGMNIPFGKDFSWYNGLRIGIYQMRFDDNEIHPTQALESELGMGLSTHFDIGIYSKLNLHVGANYIAVFTQKRLEFIFLKIGVSYTIDSPGWLREFLK